MVERLFVVLGCASHRSRKEDDVHLRYSKLKISGAHTNSLIHPLGPQLHLSYQRFHRLSFLEIRERRLIDKPRTRVSTFRFRPAAHVDEKDTSSLGRVIGFLCTEYSSLRPPNPHRTNLLLADLRGWQGDSAFATRSRREPVLAKPLPVTTEFEDPYSLPVLGQNGILFAFRGSPPGTTIEHTMITISRNAKYG